VLPIGRTGKDPPHLMETLLLPLLLLAVFWLILIRPQQKQRREVAQLQANPAPGARVITGSGLVATVVSLEDDEVVLEVAPGVTNRYVRRAIMRVLPDETATADQAIAAEPVMGAATEPATGPVNETVIDETTSGPLSERTNRDEGKGTSP
jgi:preprotein translocase subunit YajC